MTAHQIQMREGRNEQIEPVGGCALMGLFAGIAGSGATRPSATMRSDMDGGSIAAIVGAIAMIATGFIAGLWQWLSGRKKSSNDAQTSLVNGLVALLALVQGERDRLLNRISDCEANNQKQDRRITKLERALVRNNIDIPDEDDV